MVLLVNTVTTVTIPDRNLTNIFGEMLSASHLTSIFEGWLMDGALYLDQVVLRGEASSHVQLLHNNITNK